MIAGSFEPTAEFTESLEMPVSDSDAAVGRAAADHAEARAEALPEHLQLERRAWRERSPALAAMQETKAREVEHTRYRAVADYLKDPEMQAVLSSASGGGG